MRSILFREQKRKRLEDFLILAEQSRNFYYFCNVISQGMNIEKYIPELLYEHDCVIIPDFGGFVVNYREAVVDFQHQKLSPPARVASFNQSLIVNDGLLVNHISQQEQIGYNIAMEEVKAFVLTLQNELKRNTQTKLENLGYFTIQGDSLEFHPDSTQNFLRDSFGLPGFHYPLLKTAKPQQVVEETAKDIVRNVAAARHRRPSWTIAIPVAAASIALAVILLNQGKMLQTISHSNEMNPLYIPALKDINVNKSLKEPSIELKVSAISPADANESITETSVVTESNKTAPTQNIHIIAGCFSKRENADAMLEKLKQQGFSACILVSDDNLKRVSVKSYSGIEEATTDLAQLKASTGNDALWILAR